MKNNDGLFPMPVDPENRRYLVELNIRAMPHIFKKLGDPVMELSIADRLMGSESECPKPIHVRDYKVYVSEVTVRREEVPRDAILDLLKRALIAGRERMAGHLISGIERVLELEGVDLPRSSTGTPGEPKAGEMARSKRTGRMGKVVHEPESPRPFAIAIPGTIPQWMTLEELRSNFEIVKPCETCEGSGYVVR